MNELLKKDLSTLIKLDHPLNSILDIVNEITLLTEMIRTCAITSKNSERKLTSKMQWWNKELYGLRHHVRKTQKIVKYFPNEINCGAYQEAKSNYQKQIRNSKWKH